MIPHRDFRVHARGGSVAGTALHHVPIPESMVILNRSRFVCKHRICPPSARAFGTLSHAAAMVWFEPPMTTCMCGGILAVREEKTAHAMLFDFNGCTDVLHKKKRCANRDCGIIHGYKYAVLGGR